jgi:hypothetical protein
MAHYDEKRSDAESATDTDSVGQQIEREKAHDIKYRCVFCAGRGAQCKTDGRL